MQRHSRSFSFPGIEFIEKCLYWSNRFEDFSYFNPNQYIVLHDPFRHFIAADSMMKFHSNEDSFDRLKANYPENDWLTGIFSYDLKNEIEDLESHNPSMVRVPHMAFFQPRHLLFFSNDRVRIESTEDPGMIYEQISNFRIPRHSPAQIALKAETSRLEYLQIMDKLHKHIMEGDIYEINYCLEFTAREVSLDPVSTYLSLMNSSPMPFSVLQKYDQKFLISASPERFLKKDGNRIISQPMKGTKKRGRDEPDDLAMMKLLKEDQKERSENVMVVDLVRNDLSRTAVPGSVHVDELFGISSFPGVHQMISTVSSQLDPAYNLFEAIKNAFPMGSMTGAPKIKAMELIDTYEKSTRGWYSGAAGYFSPDGDFDLNVVIRSLIYDQKEGNLTYHAGSAITADSVPENEYEECLLKARAIAKMFSLPK